MMAPAVLVMVGGDDKREQFVVKVHLRTYMMG